MKTILILAALAASAAVPPLAAAELERIVQSHLSLDAMLTSNAAAAVDKFKTDYGSSDIHTEKSRSISGTVRNFGKLPADAVLEIYWIGKFTGSNTRVLLRSETLQLTIPPGQAQRITSDSGYVIGSDMNLVAIGVRRTDGFKIEGWVAKLYAPGEENSPTRQLLAVKAGDSHLADFARTPGAIAGLPKGKTHTAFEALDSRR